MSNQLERRLAAEAILADEIDELKRLREALREIAEMTSDCACPSHDIARQALEEKP